MTPRRKTEQPEGEAEAPKKKRAPRKKRTEAEAAPPVSAPSEPSQPPEAKPPEPPAKPSYSIPKAPPIGLPTVSVPPREPPKLVIEPDARYTPSVADEPRKPEDRWTPARKEDKDLSMPPKVLLQSKKPFAEVEDILEEPGARHEAPFEEEPTEHPPVRAGLYRKLGLGFAAAALVFGLIVGYVVYARATVVVHPRTVEVRTERIINVSTEPAGTDEIPGEVYEVTVAGEEAMEPGADKPKDERTEPEDPKIDPNAVYTGTVTLYNKTGSPVTLVATTRLLTLDGVLFRMRNRAAIPAGGTARADVYADQPGPTGGIGPSSFTIPGLPQNLQSVIYAESGAAMTVDGQPAPKVSDQGAAVKGSAATAEEIEELEKALHDQLVAQAKEALGAKVEGSWTGDAYVVETMNRFVNVAPGEVADRIVVRLTLRVRSVHFERAKAVEVAVEDLKRGLTSDRELKGVLGDEAELMVERADPKAGNAVLRIALQGESSVSLDSPLFDAEKLKGLDLNAVKAYFEGIEGVERVDVRFRPFWLKRMPGLKDHIEFKIAE